MKPSLFALFVFPFALAIGCSASSGTEIDDPSTAEDELRAAAACQSKSCGDACTICPPGKKNCFETAVLKECNSKGLCKPGNAICAAVDAGPPPPYQPCGGKSCGDSCSLCAPSDVGCVETAVLKVCHADGACSASAPVCAPPPPPPPPPTYDPCGDKACGASCTICPPGDPDCFETAVLKACDASGKCVAGSVSCGVVDAGPAPYQPCAGKACGAYCTLCAPGDVGCVETAVVKLCNASGTCSASAPACK